MAKHTKPSITSIAKAYSISPQALSYYIHRRSFTRDELLNPEKLFHRLLSNSRSSRLRDRLSNSTIRASIYCNLSQI
jgi:hypothetical protein